jgi:hypothetical protein
VGKRPGTRRRRRRRRARDKRRALRPESERRIASLIRRINGAAFPGLNLWLHRHRANGGLGVLQPMSKSAPFEGDEISLSCRDNGSALPRVDRPSPTRRARSSASTSPASGRGAANPLAGLVNRHAVRPLCQGLLRNLHRFPSPLRLERGLLCGFGRGLGPSCWRTRPGSGCPRASSCQDASRPAPEQLPFAP